MSKKNSGISGILARMTILPLLLLGLVAIVLGYYQLSKSMAQEVENELRNLANSATVSLDTLYPGDYNIFTSDKETLITKGDVIMNSNYQFIDSLKESTNVDYTLFYGDVRIITTICDSNGSRIIGTNANAQIVSDVQKYCQEKFYSNVSVLSTRFYCYYKPLINSNGECIGMFAAVMPAKRVQALIMRSAAPIIILMIISLFLANFWSAIYARSFKQITRKLQDSLRLTAEGKLSNTVAPELLSRKDEFGSMAHSIVDMQSSLRALVEQDLLTGLSNRRFGQERLDRMIKKLQNSNEHFSVALGDIDFFKKFNDTYGHDCGDIVLRETARLIQDHIKDYGFCSRWGGEEFLIVFTNGKYDTHKRIMEELIDRIAKNKLVYIEQDLNVTMTFGLIDVDAGCNSDLILKKVDNLLYQGKENGRNRLVTEQKNLEA